MERVSNLEALLGAFVIGCGAASLAHWLARPKESVTVQVVRGFLKAQSDRDLERMCDLASEDVIYINEPLPPHRQVHGREQLRKAFAKSPCMTCEEADLKLLQYSCSGDTVFVERLDQFKIKDTWVRIPICGYLRVQNGQVTFWKDYWDYQKYKSFVSEAFGENFRMLG